MPYLWPQPGLKVWNHQRNRFFLPQGEDVIETRQISRLIDAGDLSRTDPNEANPIYPYIYAEAQLRGVTRAQLAGMRGHFADQQAFAIGTSARGDGGAGQFVWNPEATEGIGPDDTGKWVEVTPAADALRYRGDWSAETAYSAQDAVKHAGGSWVATAATTAGQEPGEHASWDRLGGGDSLPTEDREPSRILVIDPDTEQPSWGRVAHLRDAPIDADVAAANLKQYQALQYIDGAFRRRRITRREFHAEDYGTVDTTGTNDSSSAIQEAINAARFSVRNEPSNNTYADLGGVVRLPHGVIRIDGVDVVGNGLSIEGEGSGTIVRYGGTAYPNEGARGPFRICGTRCGIRNMWLRNFGGVKAAYGVNFQKMDTDTSWIASECFLENVVFGGGSGHQFRDCIVVDYDEDAGDGNNEYHRFAHVSCMSYERSAAYIRGSQVHGMRFEDFHMNGAHTVGGVRGQYGILCALGSYLHFFGGGGGYHSEYDFAFDNFYVVSTIRGWNSENTRRLLRCGGLAGVAFPFILEGCRVETNQLPDDEIAIRLVNSGPFTIKNNLFHSTASDKRFMIFATSGEDVKTLLELGGNSFRNWEKPHRTSLVHYTNEDGDFSEYGPIRTPRRLNIKIHEAAGNLSGGTSTTRYMEIPSSLVPESSGTNMVGALNFGGGSKRRYLGSGGESGSDSGFGFMVLWSVQALGGADIRHLFARANASDKTGYRLGINTNDELFAAFGDGSGDAWISTPVEELDSEDIGAIMCTIAWHDGTHVRMINKAVQVGSGTSITGYTGGSHDTAIGGLASTHQTADDCTVFGALTFTGTPGESDLLAAADAAKASANLPASIANATITHAWTLKGNVTSGSPPNTLPDSVGDDDLTMSGALHLVNLRNTEHTTDVVWSY